MLIGLNILEDMYGDRLLSIKQMDLAAEKCAEIAEEVAIGFADWVGKSGYGFSNITNSYLLYNGGVFKKISTKELLQIYKNEKYGK